MATVLTEREWLIREGESWRCRIPLARFLSLRKRARKANGARRWRVSGNLHRPARRPLLRAVFSVELLFNEQHRVTDALYRDNPPAPV